MIKYDYPFIILKGKTNYLVFEIRTLNDIYSPLQNGKQFVVLKYFGKDLPELIQDTSNLNTHGSCDDYSSEPIITSTYGNNINLEPSIILNNNDGTNVNRFNFIEANVIDGAVDFVGPHSRDVESTVEIVEFDDTLNVELRTYYSVFKDCDVIACKRKIINKGERYLDVVRLYSLELPIISKDVTINTYDGAWAFERTRHTTALNSGLFKNSSICGSSSHKHNPYVELIDNTNNEAYAFNLIYSGNHSEIIEVNPVRNTKVMIGINDLGFDYRVNPGKEFVTPEAIFVKAQNFDEISHEMHQFCRKHLVNPNFNNKLRPIIFNSWEGTAFNINEQAIVEMAKVASSVGIEQFVMDDGWFKGRVNDKAALGDWSVDSNKFPNGLKYLASEVRNTGMDFGIWVEPEMISINSDIFRSHPEYASIIPNRTPIERRHQLIIDMANPDVVNYIFDSLSKMIDEVNPSYIKWDYNRNFSDPYSSTGIRPGEYNYRFIMGTYSLIEKLMNKYPTILFESCSSGGGRYDLGMFYYMPQCWGSDNTNTRHRTYITNGSLIGYPQSCYGAHVSRDGCPTPEGYHSSLEDRFNLACIGAFGYEMDLRKYSKEDLSVIKKQIEFYKKHQELLQFGNLSIIDDVFRNDDYFSFITVSDDMSEAILFIEETKPNVMPHIWKAKGLDKDAVYSISMREQYNLTKDNVYNNKMSGQELMENGLDLGSLYSTTDKEEFNGIFTRLIYLSKK